MVRLDRDDRCEEGPGLGRTDAVLDIGIRIEWAGLRNKAFPNAPNNLHKYLGRQDAIPSGFWIAALPNWSWFELVDHTPTFNCDADEIAPFCH